METTELLKGLSPEQRKEILKKLQAEEQTEKNNRRDAYEAIRNQFMYEVEHHLTATVDQVTAFHDWIEKESKAFKGIMREYGQLRKDDQANLTVVNESMKLEIKSNNVKTFDERADMAAERLIDYLKRYASLSEKGIDDPMYQLAMLLLGRNKRGDLDYKSISKLYELESKFDAEYVEIMELFRESNVVYKTRVNYYFHRRDQDGVWRRIEPSFCRL